MSYILDALKKSDSERQQRLGPTLATAQNQLHFQQRSNRVWLMLLAGMVVVLATAGFWLYQLGYLQITLPTAANSPAPAPLETTAERAATAPGQQAPSMPSAAELQPQPQAIDSTAVLPAPSAGDLGDAPPPAATLLELWQLPVALRSGMPPLDFSLHVYSTRRDQRSIIINNRMMREGEYVNPELALSAITPDGVVMKYRSEYFRVSILDNW